MCFSTCRTELEFALSVCIRVHLWPVMPAWYGAPLRLGASRTVNGCPLLRGSIHQPARRISAIAVSVNPPPTRFGCVTSRLELPFLIQRTSRTPYLDKL